MKVLGLIVEYNPLHNGHLYHLAESKKVSGADAVICVMSGNFIQRGEPAIVNKWARVRMALEAGIDLVIELPVVYAMASAEYFAFGAVKILDSLGVVDSICFGSECGSIRDLKTIADILVREPEEYRVLLKNELDKGVSYPSARQSALGNYLLNFIDKDGKLDNILSQSNNILGIEYIKAILRLKSNIEPLTVQRVFNSYNNEKLTGSISSATAIRRSILSENTEINNSGIYEAMPASTIKILQDEFNMGRGPVYSSDYDNLILGMIRKMETAEIANIPYMGEGLENRIKKSADEAGSVEELIDKVYTRRYTKTRIQRCIFSILTGLKLDEFNMFNLHNGPQYSRILGFSGRGRELLTKINKKSSIPIIVKTADYKYSCNPLLKRMLEIEAKSTDLYVLGYKNKDYRRSGQEYTQNIIRYV